MALLAGAVLLAMAAGAAGPALADDAQVRLPDFGDASEETLSTADEREFGEAFMRAVRARLKIVDDPLVAEYIQSLGYQLVAASEHRDLEFTFFVIEDASLNAFAAPGGYIAINAGMILATRSESELASVLAHEIAHVTQRHIARAIEHTSRSSLPVLAGVLAAIVIGAQDMEAGQAAAAAVIGSSTQSRINFTRQNEMEADRIGIGLLADAGFDPAEMAGVFEALQNASRYYQRPPEYLSTHPANANRIAEARERAAQLPYRQHQSSESYHLVRAWLRGNIAGDPQRVLEELTEELASGRAAHSAANLYGQALAMIRLGQEDEARAALERLVEQHPGNRTFLAELAGSVLRTGDLAHALALYSEGLDLYPDDRVLVRGHALALNEAGRYLDTTRLIDDYGQLYSLDSEMYRLRADAYQHLGRTVDSRADLAEHHYLSDRLDQAIRQLQAAIQAHEQGEDRSVHRISRIEARLEALEQEQKERRQEG